MAKIKACIFDLDGVIVDTAKYHYLAWKELANELGFYFSDKQNEQLKGISRMASLDILLGIGGIELTNEDKEKCASQKNQRYVEMVSNMQPDEILSGAKEFLLEVRNEGIKTALGSASKNAPSILERLKLTSLFDVIIDGNKVTKAKPDPEVFTKGADELNIPHTSCVVFEDAEAGIEAALRAHMKCIGIGSTDHLGKADLVIDGLHQMNLTTLFNLYK